MKKENKKQFRKIMQIRKIPFFMMIVVLGFVLMIAKSVYGFETSSIYYNAKTNTLTKMPSPPDTSPATEKNLVTASNTKELWSQIPENLRLDYLEKNPEDAVKKLEAKQLTETESFRDLIKNPDKQGLWDEIKKNNQLAGDVFKKMFPDVQFDFNGANFANSKFYNQDFGYTKDLYFDYGTKEDWMDPHSISVDELTRMEHLGPEIKKIKLGGDGFLRIDYSDSSLEFNQGTLVINPPNGITPPANQGLSFKGIDSPASPSPGSKLSAPGFPEAGSLGSSSSQAGGSSFEQSLYQGMQFAQQIIGVVKSAVDALIPKDSKGTTQITSTASGSDISLNNGATLAVQDEKDKDKKLILAQTEVKDGSAKFTIDSDLNGKINKNGAYIIPQVAAISTKIDTPPTTVIDDSSKEFPTPSSETRTETGALASLTGAAISSVSTSSSQSVILEGYDAEINGQKIAFYPLKPFDNLDFGGSSLVLIDGQKRFEFNGQRTYLERVPHDDSYYINKLSNKKDTENYFMILMKRKSGNYVISNDKRFTSGDEIIEHPTIKGLYIAKEREAMWKKAAGIR